MIKVSVMYPNTPGSTLDMTYYLDTHVPLCREKFGTALKGTSVDQGLAGGQPGAPPAFLVLCHFLFESVAAFQGAFDPHAEAIIGDIPNYTNTQPTIQISEVKL